MQASGLMRCVEWFRRSLSKWGSTHYRQFPWRYETDPIFQLIAEVLLQRTRADQVVPVFLYLREQYGSLSVLAKMTDKESLRVFESLGLRWRGRLLKQMIRQIVEEHGGRVPVDYEALVDLPGVGPYVAGAFLSLHCNVRYPVVDSNVVRVYGRFFGFDYDGETRRARWLIELADTLTPQEGFKSFTYSVLDLAGEVCRSRPHCDSCPLASRCCHLGNADCEYLIEKRTP